MSELFGEKSDGLVVELVGDKSDSIISQSAPVRPSNRGNSDGPYLIETGCDLLGQRPAP